MSYFPDTIVAPATPPGRGGVAVVRVSGPLVPEIAESMLGKCPPPRSAFYAVFKDQHQLPLDQGIALYFPAPHSFTGEAVLELQGHGGPVVVDGLMESILALGARLARPGEFSLRAFLNKKIDLVQAEAVADLIDATSKQSAKMALRSLKGEFSKQIETLLRELIHVRVYVEAAIDFPQEEIDFLEDAGLLENLFQLDNTFVTLLEQTAQGVLFKEGMHVVIAGKPNAGKSSLLNALSKKPTAIVTEIPGTTRDVLREQIEIDGIPVFVIDTAGLQKTEDVVEQEGIRRALAEIKDADQLLWVFDAQSDSLNMVLSQLSDLPFPLPQKGVTFIQNKIDLINQDSGIDHIEGYPLVRLSAKTGEGLSDLKKQLKVCFGSKTQTEGNFLARRRHLDALNRAHEAFLRGKNIFETQKAGELLAEELRLAQTALGEITGEFTSDDLLGQIFSSFCIGK